MKEALNKKPVHITEGSCCVNGVKIFDAVKCKITFIPEVSESRVLGSKTPDSRWKPYFKITVEMTRRRATKWAKEVIQDFLKTGITPEFTISGTMEDRDSDYYAAYGVETATAVGCVCTSAINIIELDATGEFLDDVLTFNAKDVKF